MDNVLLVQTIFDFTGFDLMESLGQIHGNGTGLGVRHQTLRSEYLTETSDDAHHVGGRDDYVEIEPVLCTDLVRQFLSAYEISAGVFGFVSLLALCENEDLLGLTGSMRQDRRASDLLVSVSSVESHLEVGFNGLVELGCGCLYDELECGVDIVQFSPVYGFGSLLILLPLLAIWLPPCGTNGFFSLP